MEIDSANIVLPIGAQNILSVLNKNGYAAYVIGGCVRDSIIGNGMAIKDWDITTNATPDQVEQLFNNTIPTGKQFGTITVKSDGELYEVTTFRSDGNYSDGRRPDHVVFGNTLQEDVERRDFTINSIAYNPTTGIIDLQNGIADISNKIIRTIGTANDRFNEDALRILRGIRFAFRYNFSIDHSTLAAMLNLGCGALNQSSNILNNVSNERIHSEIVQILSYKLSNIKLYEAVFPIIKSILLDNDHISKIGFNNSGDIYTNCDNALLKIAYIYCQAKYTTIDAETKLRDLKFSNSEIKEIINYMKIYTSIVFSTKCEQIDLSMLFRVLIYETCIEDVHKSLLLFMTISNCESLIELESILTKQEKSCTKLSQLAVNGDDMVNLGVKLNEIGTILDNLLREVIANPELNSRNILLEKAKNIMRR